MTPSEYEQYQSVASFIKYIFSWLFGYTAADPHYIRRFAAAFLDYWQGMASDRHKLLIKGQKYKMSVIDNPVKLGVQYY